MKAAYIFLALATLVPAIAVEPNPETLGPSLRKSAPTTSKTPQEIRDYFTKLGTHSTVIGVGKQQIYKSFNFDVYLQMVANIESDMVANNSDSDIVTDGAGRKLNVLPKAAAFFALKDLRAMPEANAALGYAALEGQDFFGAVFIMEKDGKYVALLKDGAKEIIQKGGFLGVEAPKGFIKLSRIEFDKPAK